MLTSLNRWLSFYCIDTLDECHPYEDTEMQELRVMRKAPLDLDIDIAEQTLGHALMRSVSNAE